MQIKKIDKSTALLIAGIILALIAGILLIKGQELYNRLVPVVYCGEKPIQPFTVIKDSDLTTVKIPKVIAQQQNMFFKKEDVVGKVANTIIPVNTPIVKNQIMAFERSNDILAAKLTQLGDKDSVAYTIPTDPISSVGGKIQINDVVDIIGTMEASMKPDEIKKTVSKIIVPNARVIDSVGTEGNVRGLTFILNPQQVLDIEYVRKKGRVSFALLPYKYNKDTENYITSEETFIKRHFSVEGE